MIHLEPISFIGIIDLKKYIKGSLTCRAALASNALLLIFSSSQPRFHTKPEVDYRFPLHFYLLNALSLFGGLLRAIGLRHRGPLISNSVNIRVEGVDDTAFLHRIKATSDSSISIFLLTAALSLYWQFSPESTQQAPHILGHNGRRLLCLYLIILLFLINGC